MLKIRLRLMPSPLLVNALTISFLPDLSRALKNTQKKWVDGNFSSESDGFMTLLIRTNFRDNYPSYSII